MDVGTYTLALGCTRLTIHVVRWQPCITVRGPRFEVPYGVQDLDATFQGSSVHELIVPGTITRITAGAFAGSELQHITLGEGLRVLDLAAFLNTAICTLWIPASITCCIPLPSGHMLIYFCSDNTNYPTRDGVLYKGTTPLCRSIDAKP